MKEKDVDDVVEEQILTIKLRAEDLSKKLMKYKLKITNSDDVIVITILHGNLEETIYTRNPLGFEEGTGNKACLLKNLFMVLSSLRGSGINGLKGIWSKMGSMAALMIVVFTSRSLHQSLIRRNTPVRKILGLKIIRDRVATNVNSVSLLLGAHFNISLKDCPSSLVYDRDHGKHVDVDSFMDLYYANYLDKGVYGACLKLLRKAFWLKGLLIKLTNDINVRYHFITEVVKSKEIEVTRIGTRYNAAKGGPSYLHHHRYSDYHVPSQRPPSPPMPRPPSLSLMVES
ncbi:hypothetical protein Tco_0870883 [Tanacetum coccineum]